MKKQSIFMILILALISITKVNAQTSILENNTLCIENGYIDNFTLESYTVTPLNPFYAVQLYAENGQVCLNIIATNKARWWGNSYWAKKQLETLGIPWSSSSKFSNPENYDNNDLLSFAVLGKISFRLSLNKDSQHFSCDNVIIGRGSAWWIYSNTADKLPVINCYDDQNNPISFKYSPGKKIDSSLSFKLTKYN